MSSTFKLSTFEVSDYLFLMSTKNKIVGFPLTSYM